MRFVDVKSARRSALRPRACCASLLLLGAGCREASSSSAGLTPEADSRTTSAELRAAPLNVAASSTVQVAPTPQPIAESADAAAPPLLKVSDLKPEIPPDACPEKMRHIPGGDFWMGSRRGRGAKEERPRFLTRVADFCMAATEVTVASYAACVQEGRCSVPHGAQNTCNYGTRDNHPVNCVDWDQAKVYCESQGARLPSEVEWEYAARGGALQLAFPWGDDAADGRTCWKTRSTCPVGSFSPGVFDLQDMSGNVWEWTNDWFGDYPWPEPDGRSKIFRGGSWSRRFEKWLSPTLRNRTDPKSWGSHLGFRCAQLAKYAECPFGPGKEPGTCRHGVVEAECADPRQSFNGYRCAPPGSADCRDDYAPVPGYGCVGQSDPATPSRERDKDESDELAEEDSPTRNRSPEFDEDCKTNQPSRPNAYRIAGGTHLGRNKYGRDNGCKNRDVGVGWNSACCP